jgi:NADPH:quinone reductase-like Zn-dependent oxidoreductase
MKAFVVEQYGKDGLRAADVPEPEVGDRDVLVKVSAASINPLDKMVRNGEFKQVLKYRTPFVLGHDVAGVVTRAGSAVRDFQVGDEVYARPRDLRIGTFAEYIAIAQDDVAPKPASLTHAIGVTGPPDPGLAKQLGAPKFMSVAMGGWAERSASRPGSTATSAPSSAKHSRSTRPSRPWRTPSRAAPTARSSSRSTDS